MKEVTTLRGLAVLLWDLLKDAQTAEPSEGPGVSVSVAVHQAEWKKGGLMVEKCIQEMQGIRN